MNEGAPDQHAHPETSTYLAVAGILAVITVVVFIGVFIVFAGPGSLAR